MKTREGAVKELPVFFVFLTQQEPQSSKCHSLNVTSLWMMQVFVSLISAAPIRFGFTSVSFCSPKTCMLTGDVSVRAVGVTIPSCKQRKKVSLTFNVFTQTHEISSERPGYLLLSTSIEGSSLHKYQVRLALSLCTRLSIRNSVKWDLRCVFYYFLSLMHCYSGGYLC